MTESIEMRNYSNVKAFPGCYANAGPFVYELIAFHTKSTVFHFLEEKNAIKKCLYLVFHSRHILWIAPYFLPKLTHAFIDFPLQGMGV